VCWSLEEFCSLPSEILQCFGKLQDPWKSEFLCVARMDSLHLLNPSRNQFIRRHIATAQFSQWVNAVLDTDRLVYRWPCSSLWVEISTLAYVTTSSHWPEIVVAYCTHTIQTKLMLKNRRYPQKSMFTATGGPRHATCSAGVICRGCGVLACKTQLSIY